MIHCGQRYLHKMSITRLTEYLYDNKGVIGMNGKLLSAVTMVSCCSVLAWTAHAESKRQINWPLIGIQVTGFGGGGDFQSSQNMSLVSAGNYFTEPDRDRINAMPAKTLSLGYGAGGGGAAVLLSSGAVNYGVALDGSSMTVNSTLSRTTVYPAIPQTYTISQTIKTNDLMTVRPFVGVEVPIQSNDMVDSFMPYMTGGYALTRAEITGQFTDELGANNRVQSTKTLNGWTIGGGVEVILKSFPISFAGEYLFVQFPNTSLQSSDFTVNGVTTPNNTFTYQANNVQTNIGRFKVSYLFGLAGKKQSSKMVEK